MDGGLAHTSTVYSLHYNTITDTSMYHCTPTGRKRSEHQTTVNTETMSTITQTRSITVEQISLKWRSLGRSGNVSFEGKTHSASDETSRLGLLKISALPDAPFVSEAPRDIQAK